MKLHKILLGLTLVSIILSCTVRNTPQNIKQGIAGQVSYSSGNMMPGPDKKEGESKGVQREIFIYAVAAASDAEGQAPLYKAIHTQLIATVKSDSLGFFQCKLKPGMYSVLTREDDHQFFSGLSNDKGQLSPVEVLPDSVVKYTININHSAVY